MRRFTALYLGLCHATSWPPTDEGLQAFVLQILKGMRLPDGRMHWQKGGETNA